MVCEFVGSITSLEPISEKIIRTRVPGTVSYAQLSQILQDYGLSIAYVHHDVNRMFLHTYYVDYENGVYGTLIMHRQFGQVNAKVLERLSLCNQLGNRHLMEGNWIEFYAKSVPYPLQIWEFSRRAKTLPTDDVFDIWYMIYRQCTYSNGMWPNELLDYVFQYATRPELPLQNTDGTVTVYRGAGLLSQPLNTAISWTTKPSIALWFACNGGSGQHIYVADIRAGDVIAYYPGSRSEYEVIVQPGKVLNARKEDMIAVTQGSMNALMENAGIPFIDYGEQAFRFGYPIAESDIVDRAVHDVRHILRVLLLTLFYYYNSGESLSERDKGVLIYFALLHDVGRVNDRVDHGHGARSVQVIGQRGYRVRSVEMRKKDYMIANLIIHYHCLDDEEGILAIQQHAQLTRKEKERAVHLFQICKDMDGLDRIRLSAMSTNDGLDYKMLRTPFGRRLPLIAGALLYQDIINGLKHPDNPTNTHNL